MTQQLNLNELKEFVNMRADKPEEYNKFMENLKGFIKELNQVMKEALE